MTARKLALRYSVRLIALLAAGVACPTLVQSDEKVDPLRWEATPEGYRALSGDRPILFYQREAKDWQGRYRRANYIHPLHGLDGATLTEDFPADHRHHRGVFWAWHQVKVGDRVLGDPWLAQDFDWRVTRAAADRDGPRLRLNTEVEWSSATWLDESGQPRVVVREIGRIVVHPNRKASQAIDFAVRLESQVEDVRIGGSYDRKGYGGFSWRIRLPDDIVFRGSTGPLTPRVTALEAGGWVDMSGSLAADGGRGGVTVFCHPENPVPAPWILRRRGSMQNVAWPGRDPLPLTPGKPWTLRYRMLIHDGTPSGEQLQRRYDEYVRSQKSAAESGD